MNRTFAIPILFFLSFLIFCYFLLPKYTDFNGFKKRVEKKELDLQAAEQYYLNLQKISTKLEDYEESLAKINSAIPEEFSLASLLNFFQKKASESGLVLKSLSKEIPLSAGQKKEERKVRIEIKENYLALTLTGTLSSFKNFLQNIEKSSRLIEVENILLPETAKELPEITILIKVHSY